MSKNTSSGITSVGIIGCGMVSAAYLKNSLKFSPFDIIAVADQRPDAAQIGPMNLELAKHIQLTKY